MGDVHDGMSRREFRWSKAARDLSYDAAFLLIVFVFLLIILGRLITWFARRHSESA